MPRSVTASLTLKIIVECEGCGHVFAVDYLLQREVTGVGVDWSKLQKEAQAQIEDQIDSVRKKIQKGDYSFVPRHNCPKCLYVQSYMASKYKTWVQVGGIVGLFLALIPLMSVRSLQDVLSFSGSCLLPILIVWGLAYLLLVEPNYLWLKRHHYPKGKKPLEKHPQVIFP